MAARGVDDLARRIAGFPELAMRRVVLAESVARVAAADAAAALAEIVRRGREGGPPFDVCLVALIGILDDPGQLGYEGLAEIYRAARDAGHLELAGLFLTAQAHAPDQAFVGRVVEGKGGRPLTLGERKNLARRSTRVLLERLLRDPDAAVLAEVLRNPRLTERDVVLLAARRPTSAEVQKLVARSRFAPAQAVRRALVLNPYTPAPLAARLCALLDRADLGDIAVDPAVAPPVRETAARLLAGRRRASP